MTRSFLKVFLIVGVLIVDRTPTASPQGLDRTVLPIRPPAVTLHTELDVRKAKPPERFEIKAPENAPNVLLIMIDDMGFRTMNSRCLGRVNSTVRPRSLRDSIL